MILISAKDELKWTFGTWIFTGYGSRLVSDGNELAGVNMKLISIYGSPLMLALVTPPI